MSNSTSPSPSPSLLTPAQYAGTWCNYLMRENDACRSGVQTAVNALASGTSPADVVNMCSNWGVSDIPAGESQYAATEGFRYGCYLTAAFNGDENNLCRINFSNPDGTNVNMPFVCPQTCQNIFTNSTQLANCVSNTQSTFDTVVDGRNRCASNPDFSCVYGLTQTGSGYDCDNNANDRKDHCVPTVVGCTLGKIQNQMLYSAQQYETETNQPPLSCLSYTTSGMNNNSNGNNNSNPMFPDGGNVYPDGSGGGGGGGGGNNSNSNGSGGSGGSGGGGGGSDNSNNSNGSGQMFPDGNVY